MRSRVVVVAILLALLGFLRPMCAQGLTVYGMLRCSPSGRYLAFVEGRGSWVHRQNSMCADLEFTTSIVVTDAHGKRISVIQPKEQISELAWTTSDRLVVVDEDEFAKGCAIYDLHGRRVGTVPVESGIRGYIALAGSPDGRYLAYVTGWPQDTYLVVADMKDGGRLVVQVLLPPHYMGTVAWSPNSRTVAVVDGEHMIVAELPDFSRWGKPLKVRRVVRGGYEGQVVLTTDGSILSVGSEGVNAVVGSGAVALTKTEFDKLVPSPDGKRFAAIKNGESLVVGSIFGRKVEFSERAKDDIVDLCWHPGGKTLYYLTHKGEVKVLRP